MVRKHAMNNSKRLQGTVIRAVGGFYYVDTDQGVFACRARGRFKVKETSVLVGDRVEIIDIGQGEGVVDHVLPRQTLLSRPAVANVNQMLLVFAMKEPDLNLLLVDRFLAMAEGDGLPLVLVFNKIDLATTSEVETVCNLYRQVGYPVIPVSAATGTNISTLQDFLHGKISAFAGPSGVGKSSLLNAVQPGLRLQVGELSEKIKRGRHTTRHTELLPLTSGGYVVDTPGFSQVETTGWEKETLGNRFPEFRPFLHGCRFPQCLHDSEPDCAVKQAVEVGQISRQRYDHYLKMLHDLETKPRWR